MQKSGSEVQEPRAALSGPAGLLIGMSLPLGSMLVGQERLGLGWEG